MGWRNSMMLDFLNELSLFNMVKRGDHSSCTYDISLRMVRVVFIQYGEKGRTL